MDGISFSPGYELRVKSWQIVFDGELFPVFEYFRIDSIKLDVTALVTAESAYMIILPVTESYCTRECSFGFTLNPSGGSLVVLIEVQDETLNHEVTAY